MVVYEVNLSIDREIEQDDRTWLDDRVRRILDDAIFLRAERRTSP